MIGGQGNYGRLAACIAALAAALLLLGCNNPPVTVPAGMLLERNGVYYHEVDTNTPFSGVAEAFHTNTIPPAKRLHAPFRYGRLHGLGIIWHTNGIKKQEIEYNQGLQVLRLAWTDTGVPIPIQQVAIIPPPPSPPATNTGTVFISQLTRKGELAFRGNDSLPYTGRAVEKFPNGELKQEDHYAFGQRQGSSKTWHPNGKQLKYEATFTSGKLDGQVIWWTPDGKKEYEATWVAGVATLKVTFAPDGTESGRMENGMGKLTFYHPNGRKRLEEFYVDSRLTRAITWDEGGKQIADLDFSPPSPPNPPNN